MKHLPSVLLWLLLPLLAVAGCRRGGIVDETALTDSVLSKHTDLLFADPKKADRRLAAFQQTLTDSAAWYCVQLYRGTAHRLMGDTATGARIYAEVEAWCHAHPGNDYTEGQLWNHRGVEEMMQGRADRAAPCYERAFTFLNRPPKQQRLIATTINLADIYMQAGQMPKAAGYYRYALYLSDSLGNRRDRNAIYCGLAQVYMELENFAEAHHFFDLAGRDIAAETTQTQFFYYFALGNCYYLENRYAESLRCFERAHGLAVWLNNSAFQLNCLGNMGEIYLMLDRLPEARRYLSRCRQALAEIPNVAPNTRSYLQSLFADLELAEGHPERARDFLQLDADSIFVHSPRYLMLHYRRLQRYAARDKKWRQAYEYQSQAQRYADTLSSLQSRNNVAELAQRYERDTTLLSQRLALADYATRNVRQQSYIILAIAAAVVLGLLGLLGILVYRRQTRERLKRQVERMTELRMDIVRNRVSPHYIFNVLGTVLPKLQRYPDLVGPVEMLIDVLRGNLLTSGKVAVPLRDELALVRRYVSLHHYTRGERPAVVWQVGEGLDESPLLVPSMSLQIPVENALKHAFPTLTDESAIHIVVEEREGMLHLRVTDNGQGYNPGLVRQTGRDTGTGLRLLTRTIEILNRYNRHQAAFRITNVEPPHHGTSMELSLPVDYNFSLPGTGTHAPER